MPGGKEVEEGLVDLRAGRLETAPALLVAMAVTTLRRLGIPVPPVAVPEDAGPRLYRVLATQRPRDTHGLYLGLVGRLDSFLRAREHQVFRARRLAARVAPPA